MKKYILEVDKEIKEKFKLFKFSNLTFLYYDTINTILTISNKHFISFNNNTVKNKELIITDISKYIVCLMYLDTYRIFIDIKNKKIKIDKINVKYING